MTIPTSGSAVIRPTLKIDRIGRNLLFTTAFVQHEISPGKFSTGTAFYYDALLTKAENPNAAMPMLITNKHVVAGATNGTVRFLRAENNEPSLGNSVSAAFTEADWVGHPDPDVDVCAASIAGVFTDLENKGQPVFHRVITQDLLPTQEVLDDLDVVEPVTFVGYPNSLFDSANLTPIVRRGTTATPVQLDYCGKPQFLIDASIFPGSSGSPVFLINEGGYNQGGSFMVGQSRVLFLGVVAAVHYQQSTGKIVTSGPPTVQFDQMIDLGLVFKWSAIEETVEELCSQKGFNRRMTPPTSASTPST